MWTGVYLTSNFNFGYLWKDYQKSPSTALKNLLKMHLKLFKLKFMFSQIPNDIYNFPKNKG